VANAGVWVVDTRGASADGYELTFSVNYLAHAQLIGDLLGSFAARARIVLLGSNTYHANLVRRMMGVQPARWRDPIELVPRPATFALFRRDRYGSGPTTDPPVGRGSGTPRTSAS
jgi:NAD(P)-dependent dehydrogenase (short-subunit alcohol dehydrogenase family)